MKVVFWTILLLFFSGSIPAQQKKNASLEEISATLDSARNSFKSIFKKGNTKGGEPGQNKKRTTEKTNPSILTEMDAGREKGLAGTLHPAVKYIDNVNRVGFKEGVLIVEKNGMYSLIDTAGNTIIPYSKASLSYIRNNGGSKDFFRYLDATDNKKHHLINSRGQKILDLINNNTGEPYYLPSSQTEVYMGSFDKDFLILQSNGDNGIALDKKGNIYHITHAYGLMSEGLVIAYGEKLGQGAYGTTSRLFGAKNLKNQWVVPPLYEYLGPFSEGYAVAGKRDERGDLKYGFVDNKGKEIIAFQYTVRPGSFRYGRALIRPPYNSSSPVVFAFIDKKGNVVFQVTKEDRKNKKAEFSFQVKHGYIQGLLFDLHGVTDTMGKRTAMKDFLQKAGLPDGSTLVQHTDNGLLAVVEEELPIYPASVYEYNRDYFIYECYNKEAREKNYGIYWIRTGEIVPPVFTAIGNMDPLSKFFYAKFRLKKGTGTDAFHEGYINKDGVFILLKKTASEW